MLRPCRILLIEDDDTIRSSLAAILRFEGCEVRDTEDGEGAMRILEERSGPVDLILLDLLMPRMCGRRFIERLRALPLYRIIPLVLVTADPDAHEYSRESGYPVVHKPFDLDHLFQIIENSLWPQFATAAPLAAE